MGAVRVLVVDDSPTMRQALGLLMAGDGIQVVGEAGDGLQALEMEQRLRPQVVTMDLCMPGLDGLAATRRLATQGQARVVVVAGTSPASGATLAFEALRAGAVDAVAKPEVGSRRALDDFAQALRQAVLVAAEAALPAWPGAPLARPFPPPGRQGSPISMAGLVASTGGPAALAELLSPLPADLAFPLLLVQHMAAGFQEAFIQWLAGHTALAVGAAGEGAKALPGWVYLAPPGRHLECGPGGILHTPALKPGEPGASGDRMLGSLAAHGGGACLGAVLTGMGRDGSQGLLALRRAGGLALAQEGASCAVFGMPKACLESGACQSLVTMPYLTSLLASGVLPALDDLPQGA